MAAKKSTPKSATKTPAPKPAHKTQQTPAQRAGNDEDETKLAEDQDAAGQDEQEQQQDGIELVLGCQVPEVDAGENEDGTPKAKAGLRSSGIVQQVFGGLRSAGVSLSIPEAMQALLLLVDLIQTVGPKVQDLIDAVRKALGK